MPKAKPTTPKQMRPYLVAEPANFPGLRIPLLSDEECKAREVSKVTFPPFETWSPEQQEAGRKLAGILLDLARPQALRLMLEEIECLPQDGKINLADIEPMAAVRGIERINAGQWKPEARETHGLDGYILVILEMFADRRVSLLITPEELKKANRRRAKSEKPKPVKRP